MHSAFTRRDTLKLLAAAALASGSVSSAFATHLAGLDDVSSVSTGQEISIVPSLFGTSGGGNLAKMVDDSGFMAAFGKLAPGIFRYPGGNGANWFDIATGLYVKKPVVARAPNTARFDTPFTFDVLKRILRQTHAEPSIVLNLLTGDLDSQMKALRSAQASGIQVKRIELGNEYYLRGAAAGTTAYEQVFPTAADYARLALKYAAVLRKTFPDCQIAVPILARDSNGARENAWNENLLKNIDTSIDGVIAHIYRRLPASTFGEGAGSNPLTARGGPQSLFAAAMEPDAMDVVRDAVRAQSRRVWVTETNVSDPGHWSMDKWVHGLALAVNMMNMLAIPRVEQVLCWSLLGDETFALMTSPDARPATPAGPPPGSLTANGFACMLLFQAARGKTSARPMMFSSNTMQTPTAGKPVPSLFGWQYGTDSALVLNLSPKSQTVRFDGGHLAHSAFYQLSADANQVIRDQSSFTVAQGTTESPMSLPPYSMTHIHGK